MKMRASIVSRRRRSDDGSLIVAPMEIRPHQAGTSRTGIVARLEFAPHPSFSTVRTFVPSHSGIAETHVGLVPSRCVASDAATRHSDDGGNCDFEPCLYKSFPLQRGVIRDGISFINGMVDRSIGEDSSAVTCGGRVLVADEGSGMEAIARVVKLLPSQTVARKVRARSTGTFSRRGTIESSICRRSNLRNVRKGENLAWSDGG